MTCNGRGPSSAKAQPQPVENFKPPRLRPARELIAERLAAIPTRFGRPV
jgi:hypothetical protein